MSNNATPAPASALPFLFGGFAIPAGCRRIFITAELEPSNSDPRIQPTGFPDIGPVLYPDPAEKNGLIALIESEPSMANRLEEVCFENKYEGVLNRQVFAGLPYLRVETGNGNDAVFRTASTLDGHRFASDFLARGRANFGNGEQTLAEHIRTTLHMSQDGSTMPIARIPDAFALVFGLDTMSLIHGFQISNEQISFVGLRLPRALSASIIGLGCERISVPGIKFNVGQVRLDTLGANGTPGQYQAARVQLLLAISLWKVATFLDLLNVELSLRTECKLRLKRTEKGQAIMPTASCEGGTSPTSVAFPFPAVVGGAMAERISTANVPANRSPLTLQFA